MENTEHKEELTPQQEYLKKYEIDSGMNRRLTVNFRYHSPKPDQIPRYQAIRDKAREFAELILHLTPTSREQSIALTHLDELVYNANAAIARNE